MISNQPDSMPERPSTPAALTNTTNRVIRVESLAQLLEAQTAQDPYTRDEARVLRYILDDLKQIKHELTTIKERIREESQ